MAVHGYILIAPGSITSTGTSATVNANGKITFTSVSALNVNNIFSIEYDNYLIVAQYKGSTSLNVTMRLRGNTVDSALKYDYQSLTTDNITIAAARSTSQTSMAINTTAGNLTCSSMIYVYRPYTTSSTAFRCSSVSDTSSAFFYDYVGQHANTPTATPSSVDLYDGFSLLTSAGSITGTLTVYGAKK